MLHTLGLLSGLWDYGLLCCLVVACLLLWVVCCGFLLLYSCDTVLVWILGWLLFGLVLSLVLAFAGMLWVAVDLGLSRL